MRKSFVLVALLAALSAQAKDVAQARSAPPVVQGAWVRSTVPGQQGTGAFMRITAVRATTLVGIVTPLAGVAEVHEMRMDRDVMRMRPVEQLELPAGRTIEFKPGGYHLMLMDLKQPLKPGTTVPLTLLLRDATGAESKLQLQVPVATTPPPAAAAQTSPPRKP